MKKKSQIFLTLSFALLFLYLGVEYVLGYWINFFYIPLILSFVFFVFTLFIERVGIKNILLFKSNKQQINILSTILLSLALFILINSIAVRINYFLDFTTNKQYTLAKATQFALSQLKDDIKIKVFYKKVKDYRATSELESLLLMLKAHKANLKYEFIDVFEKPQAFESLMKKVPVDTNQSMFVFYEYKGEVKSIAFPHRESDFIKVFMAGIKRREKNICYTSGHREITALDEMSLYRNLFSEFSINFVQVENLNTLEQKKCDALAILGPGTWFEEAELEKIRKFVRLGRGLLIAADPGQKHGLARLTKTYQIEFLNNYVFDKKSTLGGSVILSKAMSSIVTDNLNIKEVVLPLVSIVQKAPRGTGEWRLDVLLTSPKTSYVMNEMGASDVVEQNNVYPLAILSTNQKSRVITVGDSDFMTNDYIMAFANKEFAFNITMYLLGDISTLSVVDKLPIKTNIYLTYGQKIYIIAFSLLIPILLLIVGVYAWVRNKDD